VRYCPWIGARAPWRERVADLARTALGEALGPLVAAGIELPSSVFACSSHERGPDIDAIVEAIFQSFGKRVRADRAWDEAGVFSALDRADKLIADDARRFVAIVCADSLVSLDALTLRVTRGPSEWSGIPTPASEGAAAFVVTSAAGAREAKLPVLATIDHASVHADTPTDRDDDPIEGRAMTAAIRALPARRLRFAFGQTTTDSLRATEWHIATARARARFEDEQLFESIEAHVGAVAAAAGAMNLAFGIAGQRHRAVSLTVDKSTPLLAWAISPDGTRGIGTCIVEAL
jgi:hypothetical protein